MRSSISTKNIQLQLYYTIFWFVGFCFVTKKQRGENHSRKLQSTWHQWSNSLHAESITQFHHKMSTIVLTQHINIHCQFCLKQASSTSLAVINCLTCFPMILSEESRHRLQLGILGLDSGRTSHRSHDLSVPPSPPAPLTFTLCPSMGSGWTGSGWVRRCAAMSYGPSQDMVNMPGFLMHTERHSNYNYRQ